MILLEPTEELIELYGSFWRNDAKVWTVVLHEGDEAVDVRDCLRGKLDFGANAVREALIDEAFGRLKGAPVPDERDVVYAVLLLDRVYGNQLANPVGFARGLRFLFERDFENTSLLAEIANPASNNIPLVVDEIAMLEREGDAREQLVRLGELAEGAPGKRAYSFATKFCNRLNAAAFPIFDSVAASLVHHYNEQIQPGAFTKASFGGYSRYIEAYDSMRERFGLGGCSYSDIDHFLWVYGKLLKAERDTLGAQVDAGTADDAAKERWRVLRGIFNTGIEYKRPDSEQLS